MYVYLGAEPKRRHLRFGTTGKTDWDVSTLSKNKEVEGPPSLILDRNFFEDFQLVPHPRGTSSLHHFCDQSVTDVDEPFSGGLILPTTTNVRRVTRPVEWTTIPNWSPPADHRPFPRRWVCTSTFCLTSVDWCRVETTIHPYPIPVLPVSISKEPLTSFEIIP